MKKLINYFFKADHWIEGNYELVLKIAFVIWIVVTAYLAWAVWL